jgi:PhnB protein
MSEVELTEQLDQAIDAMMATGGQLPSGVDEQIAQLLGIAVELRELPRVDFKARLQNELKEEAAMSTATKTRTNETTERAKKDPKPPGRQTVTPYLLVSDVHQETDFIKQVFGAKGKVYGLGSQGGFHSEFRIGDSMLMIGGGGKGATWQGAPVPASLHAYVQDVDRVYQQAMQSGATSLMPPTDMEYGERGAAIEDVGGNHWYLATAFGPSYVPEGLPNVMPYFNLRGAAKMIEFLEQALGAEQIAAHKSPAGTVLHAKLRVGDSIVEMGEAHGEWQPRPMHFMVYVDDCDEAYERAMKAEGTVSVGVPANAPYGGRTGTIQDPFGNTWYLSSTRQKKEANQTIKGNNE